MLVSISEGEALEGELAAILLRAADMFAIVELSRWIEETAIVKSRIWSVCERRAVASESASTGLARTSEHLGCRCHTRTNSSISEL
jgi:hypothetical protein